jgi:hypothetical protein
MGIAVFIEVEQFGRQRFAAGVSLTFVGVDVHSQLSRHSDISPGVKAREEAREPSVLSAVPYCVARPSYSILHSALPRPVKPNHQEITATRCRSRSPASRSILITTAIFATL